MVFATPGLCNVPVLLLLASSSSKAKDKRDVIILNAWSCSLGIAVQTIIQTITMEMLTLTRIVLVMCMLLYYASLCFRTIWAYFFSIPYRLILIMSPVS